jgi:hypothetical protein
MRRSAVENTLPWASVLSDVECAVEEEVERVQVGELEALHRAGDHAVKVRRHALHRELPRQERVPVGPERDDAHVRRVPLVARAGVREIEQAHLHESSSTVGATTVLSMSAGQ